MGARRFDFDSKSGAVPPKAKRGKMITADRDAGILGMVFARRSNRVPRPASYFFAVARLKGEMDV